MTQHSILILNDPAVRAALKQAWQESKPGVSGGHEEGGFILRDAAGNLSVARWPKGTQDTIILPPRPNCRIGGKDIVASFQLIRIRGAIIFKSQARQTSTLFEMTLI